MGRYADDLTGHRPGSRSAPASASTSMSAQEMIPRLRVVVLDSPYDTWGSHPDLESVFAKMIGLKLRGYGKEYPYGVMAVDTTDFIATHLLVCEETPQGLFPLTGFKSVTARKCADHGLVFPGLTLVQNAHAQPHEKALEVLMKTCTKKKMDIAYTGSWTIDPALRGQKEKVSILRELFVMLYVCHHEESGHPMIVTGGTLRFKVERLHEWMGHQRLTHAGRDLPPIQVAHLAGENVVLNIVQKFSPEARELSFKWREKWIDRLHFHQRGALTAGSLEPVQSAHVDFNKTKRAG